MLKKIKYIITQRYNPYRLYWFDLLTERYIKNRRGECIDCVECCKYNCVCTKETEIDCYCQFVDLEINRCIIHNKRTCNIWFPISQKEIDYRKEIQPNFKCKFSFNVVGSSPTISSN